MRDRIFFHVEPFFKKTVWFSSSSFLLHAVYRPLVCGVRPFISGETGIVTDSYSETQNTNHCFGPRLPGGYNPTAIYRTMTTKITELTDKLVCAEWCPIREYSGLVALGSKVRFLLQDEHIHTLWSFWLTHCFPLLVGKCCHVVFGDRHYSIGTGDI